MQGSAWPLPNLVPSWLLCIQMLSYSNKYKPKSCAASQSLWLMIPFATPLVLANSYSSLKAQFKHHLICVDAPLQCS